MNSVPMPQVSEQVYQLVQKAEDECASSFARIDEIERINTRKVLRAFQEHRISYRHFSGSTGYGYEDIGRDNLSSMFAQVLGCEAALVRSQIASGTHALALCLYGILRPGDNMVSAAGKPYDTLEQVIGIAETKPGEGSLKEFGIGYKQVELLGSGDINIEAMLAAIDADTKLVLIQRSRGYDWRPSLSVKQIECAVKAVHAKHPGVCVMVDNCYGEFTDAIEPGDVGVDILAGSLIKNPGGGIAPTGGYIAGQKDLMERISYRLTSPGIGAEVGSNESTYRPYFQGLFMAPHTVAQAIKTAVLASKVFENFGLDVHPKANDGRNDIIQAIRFENPDKLIKFVQAIQMASPVDSEALPEPWAMPGYQDEVIMAAGTFVAGASIELSADAPIREPYIAYLQGGLTYAHGRIAIEGAVAHLLRHGLLTAL